MRAMVASIGSPTSNKDPPIVKVQWGRLAVRWGADPLVRGRSPDRPFRVYINPMLLVGERDQGIARGPGGPPPLAAKVYLIWVF